MTDAQGARRRQQQAVVWTEDFSIQSSPVLHSHTEQEATGNHYLVLQGPGRLTHIRQVQSAPIDTWTCDFSFGVLVENR